MGTDHDHGHGHGASANADRRWLGGALALILAFIVVEVVVAVASGSLALLSDAAHMLSDAGAIVLALVAIRLAATPPRAGYTYGLKRAEILSAQANGITLLLISGWLAYEAIQRLVQPHPVDGLPVLLTAIAGIAVNLVATWLLRRADRRSLNIEGAYQHILTDLAGFIATAISAAVIMATGWPYADTVASLLVVAIMIRAGVVLLRDSVRVLLEAAPVGLEPERIGPDMLARAGVVEVHDLHVWEITSGSAAISAHVLVQPDLNCHRVRVDLEDMLAAQYGLTHTTLQVDHASPALHRIGSGPDAGAH